ncbi:hypothetical protein N752_05810 [Desulforamulus aquiferis]|nr:hypothetical protein N752_05810 [Desulforamulus aquiferis]
MFLNMGLPVLGLLLVNPKTNRYTFHVGADPSPITALERCLTEIYQGRPQDVEARFHPMPVNFNEKSPDLSWRAAYYETTSSGFGQWPSCIFSETDTYSFTGFSNPISYSDANDLAYLVNKVKELGRDLFIRDVSFLDFPAFQIYIPGMSETDFIFEKTDFPNWMDIVRNHRTLLNLRQATDDCVVNLANAISRTAGLTMPVSFEPRRWFLSNVHPELQQLSKDYLLTMLYLRIGSYNEAANYMDMFMQSEFSHNGPRLYYRALHSYLQLRPMTFRRIKSKIC